MHFRFETAIALTNAVEQGFIVQGFTLEEAGLMTSVATGGLATLMTIMYSGQNPKEQINLKVATALVAETGFRLLPTLGRMISPEIVAQNAINWVGIPLILLSNPMKAGNMKVFMRTSGAAFLIRAFAGVVHRVKELAI